MQTLAHLPLEIQSGTAKLVLSATLKPVLKPQWYAFGMVIIASPAL